MLIRLNVTSAPQMLMNALCARKTLKQQTIQFESVRKALVLITIMRAVLQLMNAYFVVSKPITVAR